MKRLSACLVCLLAAAALFAVMPSAEGAKITKPYTAAQISEAETAMATALKSFYLQPGDPDYQKTTDYLTQEVFTQTSLTFRRYTPDLGSITRIMYADLYVIAETGDFEAGLSRGIDSDSDGEVREEFYEFFYYDNYESGESFCERGYLSVSDSGTYLSASTAYNKSKAKDLRTHIVELYGAARQTRLDLSKTVVKLVSVNEMGSYFYFTDGENSYVTPLNDSWDYLPTYFGLLGITEADSDDANSIMKFIEIGDFVKACRCMAAMVKYYGETYPVPKPEPGTTPMVGYDFIVDYGMDMARANGDPLPDPEELAARYYGGDTTLSVLPWVIGGAVLIVAAVLVAVTAKRKAKREKNL